MDERFGFFLLAPFLVLIFAVALFMIACRWKIFTKAGEEGWKAIIPIYNIYILLKIVGKPGWWLLLFLVPLVNIVFAVWTCNMLSKSFGKDEGFTVGLILLSIIFMPILAFGSSVYLGPYGNKEAFDAYRASDITLDAERNN